MACTLALLAVGCGELGRLPTEPGDDDPIDPSATFTRVQNEVFTPSCTFIGCHDTLGRSQDLVLVSGQAYAELVGRASGQIPQLARVQPGDPDQSYLYWKITGRAGIVSDRMPLSLPPLPPAQIELIRNWIRRGAPND